MPYNPETEQFFQSPSTIVDSTPDGDTVQEGFNDRLTPAMAGVYTDINLLKENGMIGVGIPATTTSRGIGRVATLADMEPGAVVENGPAFLEAGDIMSVRFIVGEFYYFRHPTMKPGFAAAQGGLISGAYQGKNITEYPIWAYLQTTEGQKLCKTEAQWQAMTKATWATLADDSKVGWNGIGGAPYYVQNLGAGTLRMPDLRGMYAEAVGFNSLGVGDAQGDQGREIFGSALQRSSAGAPDIRFGTAGDYTGAMYVTAVANGRLLASSSTLYPGGTLSFASSRVVPIGPAFAPRRWGSLACAYLGTPA